MASEEGCLALKRDPHEKCILFSSAGYFHSNTWCYLVTMKSTKISPKATMLRMAEQKEKNPETQVELVLKVFNFYGMWNYNRPLSKLLRFMLLSATYGQLTDDVDCVRPQKDFSERQILGGSLVHRRFLKEYVGEDRGKKQIQVEVKL